MLTEIFILVSLIFKSPPTTNPFGNAVILVKRIFTLPVTYFTLPKVLIFCENSLTVSLKSKSPFIVVCFNNLYAAEMLYNKSIEFWTGHAEQGGMNYLYQNQDSLNIKVSIVDFPYNKANSLYNVRSKGSACGGDQMRQGKLYSGNYKDPNSRVIGDVYPTSTYQVRDNKLFTPDNKQIKVFHYAEALGVKTKEEYNEAIYEMKNIWFNKETKKFLIEECDMNF
jgi:hypothetical protein